MPPIRRRDFIMPVGAFGAAVGLISFIYSSIGSARRNAVAEREKMYDQVMDQRRRLGMEELPRQGRRV